MSTIGCNNILSQQNINLSMNLDCADTLTTKNESKSIWLLDKVC